MSNATIETLVNALGIRSTPIVVNATVSNLANKGAKLESLKGQIKPLADEAESIITEFYQKAIASIDGASMEWDKKKNKWVYSGVIKGDKVNLLTEETRNLLHYVSFQTRASWNEEKLAKLAEKYGIPANELNECKTDGNPFPVMRDA
jgi:hypothetical protein